MWVGILKYVYYVDLDFRYIHKDRADIEPYLCPTVIYSEVETEEGQHVGHYQVIIPKTHLDETLRKRLTVSENYLVLDANWDGFKPSVGAGGKASTDALRRGQEDGWSCWLFVMAVIYNILTGWEKMDSSMGSSTLANSHPDHCSRHGKHAPMGIFPLYMAMKQYRNLKTRGSTPKDIASRFWVPTDYKTAMAEALANKAKAYSVPLTEHTQGQCPNRREPAAVQATAPTQVSAAAINTPNNSPTAESNMSTETAAPPVVDLSAPAPADDGMGPVVRASAEETSGEIVAPMKPSGAQANTQAQVTVESAEPVEAFVPPVVIQSTLAPVNDAVQSARSAAAPTSGTLSERDDINAVQKDEWME